MRIVNIGIIYVGKIGKQYMLRLSVTSHYHNPNIYQRAATNTGVTIDELNITENNEMHFACDKIHYVYHEQHVLLPMMKPRIWRTRSGRRSDGRKYVILTLTIPMEKDVL